MNILTQKVLVLNRLWQGIAETDCQTAMCDLCRGVATGIATDNGDMRAVPWAEWVTLPIRDGDRFLRTIHGPIRAPTVICKSSYAKMPIRRPKLDRRGVGERDGYTCQVSGKHCPDGTLDHVTPRSRGGRDTWENLVWMEKTLNHRKGDKTMAEAGLKLIRQPFKPKTVPACARIQVRHPDWKPFILGR
jgi:5-methylcytosine-specific restriction endonuclease McrA